MRRAGEAASPGRPNHGRKPIKALREAWGPNSQTLLKFQFAWLFVRIVMSVEPRPSDCDEAHVDREGQPGPYEIIVICTSQVMEQQ